MNKPAHDTEKRRKAFIQNQNHCPLCNTKLAIKVETYLEDGNIREEAECPKCDLLARVKDHKMH